MSVSKAYDYVFVRLIMFVDHSVHIRRDFSSCFSKKSARSGLQAISQRHGKHKFPWNKIDTFLIPEHFPGHLDVSEILVYPQNGFQYTILYLIRKLIISSYILGYHILRQSWRSAEEQKQKISRKDELQKEAAGGVCLGLPAASLS